MSLKDAFQNAAVAAFNATRSVQASVRYDSFATTVHNSSTGAADVEYDRYMASVIFETYETRQVDGVNVHAGDIKALIPVQNLPVTPTARDCLEALQDGEWRRYSVIDKSTDPAEALWVIQLRQKG